MIEFNECVLWTPPEHLSARENNILCLWQHRCKDAWNNKGFTAEAWTAVTENLLQSAIEDLDPWATSEARGVITQRVVIAYRNADWLARTDIEGCA